MANLIVSVVEGDKVEISDGTPLFTRSFVLSPAEAEGIAYALLDAAEEAARGGEPTAAQLESLNNPDSAPIRTEDTPRYREIMREAVNE